MNENNTRISFSDIISNERRKRGLSLVEFANYIGFDNKGNFLLSPSYLSKIENNKADSPGFKNVCLLTEKLSLDFRLVFASFGYGQLIKDYKKLENIEDIFKLSNIKVPLSQDAGCVIDYFLDLNEKEILISIFSNIFNIGVCTEERILHNLEEVIKRINDYRSMRQENAKRILRQTVVDDIPYINFSIKVTDKAKSQMDFYGFTNEEINEIISSYHEFINQCRDGDLSILVKGHEVSINLTIDKTCLTINSISYYIE